jgi:hypothetical protein
MSASSRLRPKRRGTAICRKGPDSVLQGCPCCSPVFKKLMFGPIKSRAPVERRCPLISRSGRESASAAERPRFQLLPPPVWARKPVTTNYSQAGAIFHSARFPL